MSDCPGSIELLVSHSGRSVHLTFPPDATVGTVQAKLEQEFLVPKSAQKLLTKGRKLDTTTSDARLSTALGPSSSSSASSHKLLLVGPRSDALAQLKADEDLRQRKHAAYEHHSSKPKYKVASTGVHGADENSNYIFHQIVPFAKDVPSYDARLKMFNRLANDEAIKAVMIKHKYAVGVL